MGEMMSEAHQMDYEHKLEDALLRMVALYESEQDSEAPMEKPYWLTRALDAIHYRHNPETDIDKCPYCGASFVSGYICCPAVAPIAHQPLNQTE